MSRLSRATPQKKKYHRKNLKYQFEQKAFSVVYVFVYRSIEKVPPEELLAPSQIWPSKLATSATTLHYFLVAGVAAPSVHIIVVCLHLTAR